MEFTSLGHITNGTHEYYAVHENGISIVVCDDDTIQCLLDKLASKQRELNRTSSEVKKCEK